LGQAEKANNPFVLTDMAISYTETMKNRLKEIRTELKLTQTQLAELVGFSLQMVQYVENGQRQLTPKWMEILSTALQIEPWMLWVDPRAVVNDKDRERISRFHTLPDHLKDAVDSIIFSPDSQKKKSLSGVGPDRDHDAGTPLN